MAIEESRPDLYTSPLFYDALSGEFSPSIDPEGRTYTLGRIMIEAYNQGDLEILDEDENPYEAYTFTPTWAGNISVKLTCEIAEDQLGRIRTAWGLWMKDVEDDKNHLHLADEGDELFMSRLSQNGTTVEDRHSIRLGDELDTAREAVVLAAETFFNR